MVNDPDFLGLSPSDKRVALSRLTGDAAFGSLSDGDTMQFVSRLKTPPAANQTLTIPMMEGQPQDVSGLTEQQVDEANSAQKTMGGLALNTIGGIAAAPAAGELAIAGANAGARALTPYALKLGQWAVTNPIKAKMLIKVIEGSAAGGAYAGTKKILDLVPSK